MEYNFSLLSGYKNFIIFLESKGCFHGIQVLYILSIFLIFLIVAFVTYEYKAFKVKLFFLCFRMYLSMKTDSTLLGQSISRNQTDTAS